MKNKTLGIGLLVILGLTILAGAAGLTNENSNVYSILGLGFVFFGVWGGIRLINEK